MKVFYLKSLELYSSYFYLFVFTMHHQVALQEKEKERDLLEEQSQDRLHLFEIEEMIMKDNDNNAHNPVHPGQPPDDTTSFSMPFQVQDDDNVGRLTLKRDSTALMKPVGKKYPMGMIPHGIAVIINNFEFHLTVPGEDPLPECRGSQVDEENLRVTWEYLQYDVRIFRNLTASELTHQLMQIALQNHEKYDSFVCCILSHGYLDGVYGTDSKPIKINDIASLFKGHFCPTLADKPKLFFIQACRGDDEDKGVAVQKDAKGDPDDALRHSLLSEADFLFGYATLPGNVSWRSPLYGSWYISKLCEVFMNYASQQDLLSMLTIVNYKVSEITTKDFKQCSALVSLLHKKVMFF